MRFPAKTLFQKLRYHFVYEILVTPYCVCVCVINGVHYSSHWEYERDDIKHMRMKFYIEGPNGKGTVHLEATQVSADVNELMTQG